MAQSSEWGPIVNFLKELNQGIDPLIKLAYIVAASIIIYGIYRLLTGKRES